MDTYYLLDTPIGRLGAVIAGNSLIRIDLVPQIDSPVFGEQSTLYNKIIMQIQRYFANPKYQLSLPINPKGTMFQHKVWEALQKIPAGTVITYGDLAKQLNSGARAIGNACRNNPLPIIIPCHRVVAKNSLGGYAGNIKGPFKLMKQKLLQHEGVL
jgi:methylated-DNA-[protein]-cysteine S-methyltransferase